MLKNKMKQSKEIGQQLNPNKNNSDIGGLKKGVDQSISNRFFEKSSGDFGQQYFGKEPQYLVRNSKYQEIDNIFRKGQKVHEDENESEDQAEYTDSRNSRTDNSLDESNQKSSLGHSHQIQMISKQQNSGNQSGGENEGLIFQKQTCIIRNSKNWHALELNLDYPIQKEKNSKYCVSSSPNNPQKLGKLSQNMAKQHIQRLNGEKDMKKDGKLDMQIQVLNYKMMLRNEIKKCRQLDGEVQRLKLRDRYMQELVKKLKQQNKILRKISGLTLEENEVKDRGQNKAKKIRSEKTKTRTWVDK